MGKEVDTATPQVPALAQTPSMELDADDVALPKLYIAHPSSQQVQEHGIPAGAIFSSLGQRILTPRCCTRWTRTRAFSCM